MLLTVSVTKDQPDLSEKSIDSEDATGTVRAKVLKRHPVHALEVLCLGSCGSYWTVAYCVISSQLIERCATAGPLQPHCSL